MGPSAWSVRAWNRGPTHVVHELDERCGDVHLLGLLSRGSRQCARQCEFTEGRHVDVERVGPRGFLGKLEYSHDAAVLDVQQPEASGLCLALNRGSGAHGTRARPPG
ncbi:MAG: hypothetical protein WKF33_03770 [Thermoleophilaceae bacterium]